MFGSGKAVDGVPVRRLRTLFEAYRVPFTPSLPFALLKENCDVLHVYLPLPWLDLCAAFKKKLSPETRLVLSIRNLLSNTATLSARTAGSIHDGITIKAAIDVADAVVFTNMDFALSVPYEIPREKMYVVPNGVDLEMFRPNEGFAFRPNQVLFVGRLIQEKGLEVLMRAMRLVAQEIPDAKLFAVVSDYYHQKDYLKRVMSLDTGFLEIRSRLPIQELAQLYRDSALLVLPSIGLESFGNVLVEAMASGSPVIATDLAGPRDLVQSGRDFNVGSVVPRNDAEALAKAIISELRSNGFYRRKNVREFVESRASWDAVAKRLISVYRECGRR
jgi:glycosyltransferase involved in cell wall biosynthesis